MFKLFPVDVRRVAVALLLLSGYFGLGWEQGLGSVDKRSRVTCTRLQRRPCRLIGVLAASRLPATTTSTTLAAATT